MLKFDQPLPREPLRSSICAVQPKRKRSIALSHAAAQSMLRDMVPRDGWIRTRESAWRTSKRAHRNAHGG
jgi:hypothetical protein